MLGEIGEYTQAEEHLREGLALAREIGQRWDTCAILSQLGELYLKQDKTDLAVPLFREALEIGHDIDSQDLVASALYGLARIAKAQGNKAEALQKSRDSLVIYESIGHSKAAEVKQWLIELS